MLHDRGRYCGLLEPPMIRPLAVLKDEYRANSEKQARWNEKGIRQVDARRGRAGHCGDEAVDSLELAGKAGIRDFKHSAQRIRYNQNRIFSNWYLYTCPMPYTIRPHNCFLTPAMDYPQAHTATVQKWSRTLSLLSNSMSSAHHLRIRRIQKPEGRASIPHPIPLP